MRFAALLTLSLLLTSCSAWKTPAHATWTNTTSVEEMERLYWQAIKDKDWLNVESHMVSNYTHMKPDGPKTKEQTVAAYRQMNLVEFSLGDFQVTDHGGTAVVTYTANYATEADGKRSGPISARRMAIWQQQKKGWALIADGEAPAR